MNRIFFITFASIVLLTPVGMNAQEAEKRGDRFDKEAFLKKKNAFITEELRLTPEEAAAFIPLSDELNQKKFEAGLKCRKLSREIRQKKEPTGEEYLQAIDECLAAGLKETELDKEYYEKFKKILSPEKLYKYRDAERKFMHDFMRAPGNRRDGNKNR